MGLSRRYNSAQSREFAEPSAHGSARGPRGGVPLLEEEEMGAFWGGVYMGGPRGGWAAGRVVCLGAPGPQASMERGGTDLTSCRWGKVGGHLSTQARSWEEKPALQEHPGAHVLTSFQTSWLEEGGADPGK